MDDDTLHFAYLDFGDGDSMGSGMDVPDPVRLLAWLINERFTDDGGAFAEFCSTNDVALVSVPSDAPADSLSAGTSVTVAGDAVVVQGGPLVDSSSAYRIDDWQALVLLLLGEVATGVDAWSLLTDILDSAGIEPVIRFRGYS